MLKSILKDCYDQRISAEEALAKINKSFPEHYSTKYTYEDDQELLDVVINVYSLVYLRDSLTQKQKNVLRYYLKSGYSDQVKKAIRLDFNMNKGHLNQINWALTSKGFLEKHPNNYRSKLVSQDLLKLKDTFLKDRVKFYTIIFNKK